MVGLEVLPGKVGHEGVYDLAHPQAHQPTKSAAEARRERKRATAAARRQRLKTARESSAQQSATSQQPSAGDMSPAVSASASPEPPREENSASDDFVPSVHGQEELRASAEAPHPHTPAAVTPLATSPVAQDFIRQTEASESNVNVSPPATMGQLWTWESTDAATPTPARKQFLPPTSPSPMQADDSATAGGNHTEVAADQLQPSDHFPGANGDLLGAMPPFDPVALPFLDLASLETMRVAANAPRDTEQALANEPTAFFAAEQDGDLTNYYSMASNDYLDIPSPPDQTQDYGHDHAVRARFLALGEDLFAQGASAETIGQVMVGLAHQWLMAAV